jgi:hypothetical protein
MEGSGYIVTVGKGGGQKCIRQSDGEEVDMSYCQDSLAENGGGESGSVGGDGSSAQNLEGGSGYIVVAGNKGEPNKCIRQSDGAEVPMSYCEGLPDS